MKSTFFSFFIVLFVVIFIDGIWLAYTMKNFYAAQIGGVASLSMHFLPACLLYILYGIGLNVFVVMPALKNKTKYLKVTLLGVLFGLVNFGSYDLTNQATLQLWSWTITIVDMAWGSFLSGTASVVATYVTRRFSSRLL